MNFRRYLLIFAVISSLLLSFIGCRAIVPEEKGLKVLAGSELKDLEPMLDEIQHKTGVRLQFEYIGTLDGAEQIMSGVKTDMAWFSHVKYLNLMQGVNNRVFAQEKIMLSPVVLGIKQSKADTWGWTDNAELIWQDVVQKASSGELHFAMTNPSSSNSGFSALIGVAAALSGKTDALQLADIAEITPKLEGFFKGQSLTSGSSGWLAEQYVQEQERLDGIINYESVLLTLNRSGQLKEKLVLIYPKEGIITADYPLLLINKDKRDEYDKLVTYLRSVDFQKEIMTQTMRRPVNSQVPLSKDFPDKILIELPFPNNREVVDQLLFSYMDEQIKPSTTYYALDVSGSMAGERLDELQQAMDNLTGADTSLTGQFARFRNREKITIMPFNSSVLDEAQFEVMISDADSLARIRTYVHSLTAGKSTAIFSTLQQAYELARQERDKNPDRMYSIVLMTDGKSNAGISEKEFQSYYQSTDDLQDIRTFTILFGEASAESMQRIADMTGGKMFDASKVSLSQIFKEIRGYQ